MWKPKKQPNNIPDKDLVWNLEILEGLGLQGSLLAEWRSILENNGGSIPYRDGVKWVIDRARNDTKMKTFVGFVKLAKYLDVFVDNQPMNKKTAETTD